LNDLSTFVCTYNSAATLEACLAGIRKAEDGAKLVVIDHSSTDDTVRIAEKYGALVKSENVSLGHARQMAFEFVDTKFMAFVDSDVKIVEKGFFKKALSELERSKRTGAVVGMAVGHRLAYGLPASLLVLRSEDFRGKVVPDGISARETYFIQERLDSLGLDTVYLADSMVHESQFRRFKPEWEGANTRAACGLEASQLAFALKVMILMSLNSRSLKNIAYVPIFYLKFLRGYANPRPWVKLDRNRGVA
jgi:glycosyltransferase involved in cell wall biosynthesis